MKKFFYYVASCEEKGKNYAITIKVGANDNLLAVLKRYKNLKSVMPCETRKRAEEICSAWTKSYIENKTFYLDCLGGGGYAKN